MSSRMGETLNLALALEGRVKPARENEQLVAIADALAELPDPDIDRGFMLALEQRILTEDLAEQTPARHLEAVPARQPAPEPIRRAPVVQMPKRRFVIRRSLVAVAATMSLGAFMVAAAATSLPGSPLYGGKRLIERVIGSGIDEQLVNRMAEYERLSVLDPSSAHLVTLADEIKGLLVQLEALVARTTDPAVLREIADLARDAEIMLRGFADLAPVMRDALDPAILATLDIQDAVKDALTIDVSIPSVQVPTPVISGGNDSPAASKGSGQRPSDNGGRQGGTKGGNGGDDDDFDGDIGGHNISEVAEGCEVPFAAQTGDAFAPVAKVMCS